MSSLLDIDIKEFGIDDHMSKRTKITIYLLSVYLAFRLIFAYTIISIPGRWIIVEGGDKIDFPLCIVNPMRAYFLKQKINTYVTEHINAPIVGNPNNIYDLSSISHQKSFQWWFHDRLEALPKYRISAINNKYSSSSVYVLLTAKDNKKIRSVVIIDKKTSTIISFDCQESYYFNAVGIVNFI
jgi:hypothetical protein